MKKALVSVALLLGIVGIIIADNEISIQTLLKVNKGAAQVSRSTGTLLIDMTGARYNTQVITCTTNNQALSKGGVVNAGYTYWRNLATGATDVVNVSFDAGVTTSMTLKAKETALFRIPTGAVVTDFYVSCVTNTVDLEFTVIED